jgi:sulfite reductase (NADPH) hemoprotein beta-component
MAEIAFVGKAPGKYQLWLGGDVSGSRLNKVYKDVIKEADLETELRPLLTRWKNERVTGERFGDFSTRVLLPEAAIAAAAAAEAKAVASVATPPTVAPTL